MRPRYSNSISCLYFLRGRKCKVGIFFYSIYAIYLALCSNFPVIVLVYPEFNIIASAILHSRHTSVLPAFHTLDNCRDKQACSG
jgi:hypothetical protein